MTQITGGRVVYGRTVQPAQYESKKAEVEFTFAVEDGAYSEEHLDKIIRTAMEKAHGMCGLAQTAKPSGKAEVTTEKPAKETKPKGKTKADLEAEKVAELSKGSGDVALDVLDLTAAQAKTETKAEPNDSLADILGPSAKKYSNTDLVDAVTKKNETLNNPKAIKDLMKKYTDQGLSQIPEDKRGDFVTELNALK